MAFMNRDREYERDCDREHGGILTAKERRLKTIYGTVSLSTISY